MNKKSLTIALYSVILFFASCQPSVEYVEVEKEVLVDNIIDTETIVYEEKEIYILNKEEIPAVEPIREYDNYITTNYKVFGVVPEGFEEIPFIRGLFKIDDIIYFTINELCYSQDDYDIAEIGFDDFPMVPESESIEFQSGRYRIGDDLYGGLDISKVYNGSPNVAYYMIDGACLRGSDLVYSTPVDTGSRQKGVYIWTVNGNPLRLMDSGRVW